MVHDEGDGYISICLYVSLIPFSSYLCNIFMWKKHSMAELGTLQSLHAEFNDTKRSVRALLFGLNTAIPPTLHHWIFMIRN